MNENEVLTEKEFRSFDTWLRLADPNGTATLKQAMAIFAKWREERKGEIK